MSIRENLDKPAYSLPELLQLQPLKRSAIYKEIKSGRLRATKAGRRTIFLADDIADWLEALQRESRSPADIVVDGGATAKKFGRQVAPDLDGWNEEPLSDPLLNTSDLAKSDIKPGDNE